MRSERDTWYITTSVGSTALFLATARALEAQKPYPLAVDPFAQVFCRAVGGPAADVLDSKAPEHPLKTADFGEHFVNFQGARTKYFDEYFRRAADAGVRQIVILAAGLDSRAYRLPWPDGTTIFELDQPQVLEFKREVLAEHGAKPKAQRREVAVDLRADWAQALRDSGFDPAKPSAWIVEGLLIYLPANAQQQLFTGVEALSAAGSRIAVEDGAPLPPEEYAAKVVGERAAARRGEQRLFFQLVYNEQFAPADQWLSEHGWTPVATPLADYLREVGRQVPGPHNAEAEPMISRNTLVSAVKN